MIACSLISLIKNKRRTFWFWNICTRLIHDITSTPSLYIWLQLKHMQPKIGNQLGNLRFNYSSCQKIKEEAWMTFKTNEMLFYCLKVICYTIIKVGCVTKKLASFGWKCLLVYPWRRHSADFTFVFKTRSGQEGLPRWRPSSNVSKSHVSLLIFLTYEECKWDFNNFF